MKVIKRYKKDYREKQAYRLIPEMSMHQFYAYYRKLYHDAKENEDLPDREFILKNYKKY